MLQWFGLGQVEEQGPSETGTSSNRSSERRRRKKGSERRTKQEQQEEELQTNRTSPITDVATDFGGTTLRTDIGTDYGAATVRTDFGMGTYRTDYGGLMSGASDGPWDCPACTYQNGPENVACEVCGSPRIISEAQCSAPQSKVESNVPNSWHTTVEEDAGMMQQDNGYGHNHDPTLNSTSSVPGRLPAKTASFGYANDVPARTPSQTSSRVPSRTASFDNSGHRTKELMMVNVTRHQSIDGRDMLDTQSNASEQARLSRQMLAQHQSSFREPSECQGGFPRELSAQHRGMDRLSTSHASVVSQSLDRGTHAADLHSRSKLRLRVIRAFDLQNKDWGIRPGDVSDPFVVMKLGEQQHKTDTINDNLNPEWNSAPFEFDVARPSDAVLHLEVFNSNWVTAHDSLGSMEVQINNLVPGQTYPICSRLNEGERKDGLEARLEIEVELLIPETPTGPPMDMSFSGLPNARGEPVTIQPCEERILGPMSTATFGGDECQRAATAAASMAEPMVMAGAGGVMQSSAPYFPPSLRPQEKFWVPLPSFTGCGPEAFLPEPRKSVSSTAAVPSRRLTTVPEYESKANQLGQYDYSREPNYFPRQQQVDLQSWREDPFYGWRKDALPQDVDGQEALGRTATVRQAFSRTTSSRQHSHMPESEEEWEQRREAEEQWKKDPFHGWLGVHERSEELEKTTDSIRGVREARNLMKLPSFREADVKRFADNREYSKLHKVAPRQHWAGPGSREKESAPPEQIWKDDAFFGWLPGRGHPDLPAEPHVRRPGEQARLNSLPSFSEDLVHSARHSASNDSQGVYDPHGGDLSRQTSRMGSSRGRRQPPQSGAQRINSSSSLNGSYTVDRIKTPHNIEAARAMGELGVLSVRVIAAYNLINCDTGILGDVSDPYVKLWLASDSDTGKRTHTINNDLNPVWNSTPFLLPLHHEDDMLHLEVYDEDTFSSDDFLGRITIPLQNIVHGQPNRAVRIRDELQDVQRGELEVEIGFSPG